MRVDVDYRNVNQSVDNGSHTISHGSTSTSRSDGTRAYAIDISGTVMDNKAYEGHGKTTEDVMQEAGQIDVAQQKDYMTVMSNSMSEEDFAKLQEEGYHPGNMDIETMVTVVDRIKAELVKAGVQVAGYTDTLDMDTLTAITGSAAEAQSIVSKLQENDVPVTKENVEASREALDKARELSELSEGTMKYMIQNEMEPAIDNIYTAEHSAAGDGSQQARGYYPDETPGYYAKKADSIDLQQLKPQIEKIIQNAGLTVDENTVADAQWLIEKGMEVTADSLQRLESLKNVDMGITEDTDALMNQIARAIGEGRDAGSALLKDAPGIYQQAVELIDRVENITADAVEQVVEDGQVINLKNLSDAQKRIQENGYRKQQEADAGSEQTAGAEDTSDRQKDKLTTTKAQLEEIRLQMTVEANVKLLKSGIQIDTTELETLVEAYKSVEEERAQLLFGNTDGAKDVKSVVEKSALYTETLQKLAGISSMPAALVGQAVEGESFTINAVYDKGSVLQSSYQAAGETYEALMTAPRSDLGDSIQKAFRNVDDLLDEIDMEVTDINRRAARILGYNQMEVSKENIETVKEADETLTNVVTKMTPAATLQMIRDGINPLETDMNAMEEYLTELNTDIRNESEKYSKYLYKLEQNQEITQEEKEAYIGIYRLIRQVEKSDGAVIGALVNQGADISFKNLLTAVRSSKKTGMNISVDDDFGGIESKILNGKSISEQINTINEIENDSKLEKQYQAEQLQDFRQCTQIEERVIQSLIDFDQPVTIDNLLAANALQQNRGSVYRNLFRDASNQADTNDEMGEEQDSGALTSVMKALQDSFSESSISEASQTDPRNAVEKAYENLQSAAEEVLQSKMGDVQATSIDIKSAALTFKQISLVTNFSKEENYEVPVKIGDELTSINLRIIRGSESSKVTATVDTALYGKVAAEFTVTPKMISGYLATDSKEGYDQLKAVEQTLIQSIQGAGVDSLGGETALSVQTIYSKNLDTNKYQEKQNHPVENQKVPSRMLYAIAKSVISTLQTGEIGR